MPDLEKIVLTFKFQNATKNKHRFEEELGDEEWSDRSFACGTLYIEKEALELLGSPERIKVTIEPIKEGEGTK